MENNKEKIYKLIVFTLALSGQAILVMFLLSDTFYGSLNTIVFLVGTLIAIADVVFVIDTFNPFKTFRGIIAFLRILVLLFTPLSALWLLVLFSNRL